MRTTHLQLIQARIQQHLAKHTQGEGADIAKALRIKRADFILAAGELVKAGELVTARVIRDGEFSDTLYRASGRVPKGTPGRKAA